MMKSSAGRNDDPVPTVSADCLSSKVKDGDSSGNAGTLGVPEVFSWHVKNVPPQHGRMGVRDVERLGDATGKLEGL
jgi:hypothetical protein